MKNFTKKILLASVLFLSFFKPAVADPESICVLRKIVVGVEKYIFINGISHRVKKGKYFEELQKVFDGCSCLRNKIDVFIEASRYDQPTLEYNTMEHKLARKYIYCGEKRSINIFNFFQVDNRCDERIMNLILFLRKSLEDVKSKAIEDSRKFVVNRDISNCGSVGFYKKLIGKLCEDYLLEIGKSKIDEDGEISKIKSSLEGMVRLFSQISFDNKASIKNFISFLSMIFHKKDDGKYGENLFDFFISSSFADVHFFNEVSKSQKRVSNSAILCGDSHAIFLRDSFCELGYEPVYRHDMDDGVVLPEELGRIFSTFCGRPICMNCGNKKPVDGGNLKRCARCKFAKYCSKQCQVKDWKKHKKFCKKKKK